MCRVSAAVIPGNKCEKNAKKVARKGKRALAQRLSGPRQPDEAKADVRGSGRPDWSQVPADRAEKPVDPGRSERRAAA